MPDSDLAAAAAVFTHVARLHMNGLVGPLWVTQEVSRIVDGASDSAGMVHLPLGRLYNLDWEWLDCEQAWDGPGPPKSWQRSSVKHVRRNYVVIALRSRSIAEEVVSAEGVACSFWHGSSRHPYRPAVPAWKVGGTDTSLPGAMFLLAHRVECARVTAGNREAS
jgi:hypothetical protein